MDGTTITLLIGVISCIIGVLTFIGGRMTRAERDGRFAEKLDVCCKGIEEIKIKLESQEISQNNQNVQINLQEQKIAQLNERVSALERKDF